MGATERQVTAKARLKQGYFRQMVLNNFGGCCGVTGLPVRELLVAAHIIPWSKNVNERLNVRNGLCLSRLHDAAFEVGLIAFDAQLKLKVSPRLKGLLPQQAIEVNFSAYEGSVLRLPDEALCPSGEFLAEHYAKRFKIVSG